MDKQATPRTRKSPRGETARQTILEAASRLFSAGGFNAVSIAHIAADVGMTQAGVLHHYPSKAELLLAVLLEREARNARINSEDRERGLDFLLTFLHTLHMNDEAPAMVQLMAVLSAESISADHPAHDYFRERYEQIVISAKRDLEPLFDPDRLPRGTTVETMARWLVALADGLRIQWLFSPKSFDRGIAIAQFYGLLRDYLREPYRSYDWEETLRNEKW